MPSQNHFPLPAGTPIDIHCHRYRAGGGLQILSLDTHELLHSRNQNPIECIPDDCYFSLGIHPWFIDRQDMETACKTLDALQHHPQLLAFGECGLDKCIATPMVRQIQLFSRQLELAERIGKPVIIHCVRAHAELLQLKKSISPSQAWILHGFSGKPALAAQLIEHGCYLSFGKALLQSDARVQQTLVSVPIERLFLETDAADASIETIHAAAATIRSLDPADLCRQIHRNFLSVFLDD
ncbi:TatD family hydrolase [Methylomonas sp. SURF-2]|uniref:TatD family hydrolase n=1 Tax=Methylomonas subterranea TaxID=2952225 RepID=A0ABT1TDZ9_9GAMM|nr:TatD family hydrolase [Methylomonas sp. SURF-2]MCQ8103687.1 TatD family hydrolase [Methylomonas sp. SURF-2]